MIGYSRDDAWPQEWEDEEEPKEIDCKHPWDEYQEFFDAQDKLF